MKWFFWHRRLTESIFLETFLLGYLTRTCKNEWKSPHGISSLPPI